MGCEDFASFSEEEQERRRGGHFGSSPLNICEFFLLYKNTFYTCVCVCVGVAHFVSINKNDWRLNIYGHIATSPHWRFF